MNNGQYYGTIGAQGYAQLYSQLFDQMQQQLIASNISAQKRQQALMQMANSAEQKSNYYHQQLLKDYRKAQGGTNINHNSIMGLLSVETKLLALKLKLEAKAAESGQEADLKYFQDIQEIEDLYNPSKNTRFETAITTAIQDNPNALSTPAAQQAAVNAILDNQVIQSTLNGIQDEGLKAAYLNHLTGRIQSELFNLQEESAGIPLIRTEALSKFGLTEKQSTEDKVAASLEAAKGKIQKVSALSADVNQINELMGEARRARSGTAKGISTEDERRAVRLFADPEFAAFIRLYDATNGQPSQQQLDKFFEDNPKTDKQEIGRQFAQAKELYATNMALIPEEYVDVFFEPIRKERQRAAQLEGEAALTGMQVAPDLEKLAAQRFLQSTPAPISLYTREQKKDLRKGVYVPQAGTDVQQTDVSIQALLRESPAYREWYNGLSAGEQVMQRYGTSADKLFKEMQANPNMAPKGRAQKLAMQLYTATPIGGKLSADELVNQTAEALKDKDLQDEARAYYAALIMNRDADTQAPVETQEANVQANVEEDMDFTFRERMMGQKAMREYERTNKPISPPVEPALQPQMQAEEAAQLGPMYQDPNALNDVNLDVLSNRSVTPLERLAYGEITEAPTALPLTGLSALEAMYPAFGTPNINPNRGVLSPQSLSQLEQGRLNALEYLRNQGKY